jgi:hypothetical protein
MSPLRYGTPVQSPSPAGFYSPPVPTAPPIPFVTPVQSPPSSEEAYPIRGDYFSQGQQSWTPAPQPNPNESRATSSEAPRTRLRRREASFDQRPNPPPERRESYGRRKPSMDKSQPVFKSWFRIFKS